MMKKLLLLSLMTGFLCLSPQEQRDYVNYDDNITHQLKQKINLFEEYKDFKGETLTIYNCADYIDDSLIEKFEERYNCQVKYYTFDTPETMYNQFTLQPEGTYDLLVPSDYMIQKLVREGLVEEINIEEDCPVYAKYASTAVRNKLKGMKADTDKDGIKDASLDNYAAGYMWGTLGIIYDPTFFPTIQEDVKSWDIFWDKNYNNEISIKNSMRDTFVVGLMHGYKNGKFDSLKGINLNAREDFLNQMSQATTEEAKTDARNKYNQVIQQLFDLVINEDNYQDIIQIVKDELISLKQNIFGFEVDSGKNDIITGKIKMNLAWSGDAVYSIDEAASLANPKRLEYFVPEDGSNVWYDGFVLPKKANKDLACKFIDFISEPEHAMMNMDYIGYTSFIACDEVFDLVSSWYGVSSYSSNTEYYGRYFDEEAEEEVSGSYVEYQGKFYECIVDSIGNLPTNEEYFVEVDKEELELGEPYDLGFIFKDNLESKRDGIIYPFEETRNQLSTQYPDEDTLARCAIMNDYGERNEDVVIMWGQVKAYTDMLPYYLILGIAGVVVISYIVVSIILKNKSTRNKRRLEKLSK